MRKPSFALFHDFKRTFDRICREANLPQQIIPYFISSHPGCTEQDMAELAAETRDMDFRLEQVQDFTPTPMTVSTVAWHAGYHPYTLEPVYAAHAGRPGRHIRHLQQRKDFPAGWKQRQRHFLLRRFQRVNVGRRECKAHVLQQRS